MSKITKINQHPNHQNLNKFKKNFEKNNKINKNF